MSAAVAMPKADEHLEAEHLLPVQESNSRALPHFHKATALVCVALATFALWGVVSPIKMHKATLQGSVRFDEVNAALQKALKTLTDKGLAADQLTEDEVDDLVDHKVLEFTQGLAIKHYLRKQSNKAAAKAKHALPFPELKEGEFPDVADLASFKPAKSSLPNFHKITGPESEAVDTSVLGPTGFTKVFINCGLPRGKYSTKLGTSPPGVLLLPPNTNQLVNAFAPASVTSFFNIDQYSSESADQQMELTEGGAFFSASTPYVGGAASFNAKGSTASHNAVATELIVAKYVYKVGDMFLKPDLQVRREENGPGFIKVNPKFVSRVKSAVRDAEKDKLKEGDIFEKKLNDIVKVYGDVIATQVSIGVMAYTEKHATSKGAAKEEAHAFAAEVKASYGADPLPYKAAAGAHAGHSSSANHNSASSRASFSWTSVCGCTGDVHNPTTVSKHITDAGTWKALQLAKFVPITELLPRQLRRRAAAHAWLQLALRGGGRIANVMHSRKECLIKALELYPDFLNAWMELSGTRKPSDIVKLEACMNKTAGRSTEQRLQQCSSPTTYWRRYDYDSFHTMKAPAMVSLHSVALHGNVIVAGGEHDGKVRVFDVPSFSMRHTLSDATRSVYSLALDGNFMVAGSEDQKVRVYDVPSFRLRHTLSDATDSVTSVALRGDFMVAGSRDHKVRVYDVPSFRLRCALSDATKAIGEVALDGNFMVAGGDERKVRVYDVPSFSLRHTLSDATWMISSVALHGNFMLTSSSGTIRVYDVPSFSLHRKLPSLWGPAVSLALDGKFMAYSIDGDVQVYQYSD